MKENTDRDLQMVKIDCPQCELEPLPPEELHKYMKDLMQEIEATIEP